MPVRSYKLCEAAKCRVHWRASPHVLAASASQLDRSAWGRIGGSGSICLKRLQRLSLKNLAASVDFLGWVMPSPNLKGALKQAGVSTYGSRGECLQRLAVVQLGKAASSKLVRASPIGKHTRLRAKVHFTTSSRERSSSVENDKHNDGCCDAFEVYIERAAKGTPICVNSIRAEIKDMLDHLGVSKRIKQGVV